ncbi:hypothetical protein AWM75_04415 [Aerococcus urinaehominis]|uniref:Uncharacterized protein n=1 Tax=Aerococcus urinaehominis TaxID=128944 RepID=A0A0X8FL36_9LACT|nr:PIN domain-containing protein [Aerococcus urinaehominis]AMB99290.1 hypothetical protein AWM75_04415 [Aerococcus urinaehominis]SDM19130.1 Uncharacterized conserved protein YacL, contains PIN and TRAM domains [Aerococcus urinaehominis]
MSKKIWSNLFKAVLILVGASLGYYLLPLVWQASGLANSLINHTLINMIIGALIFLILMQLLSPYFRRLAKQLDAGIRQISIVDFTIGIIGLIMGLLIAWLINIPLVALRIPFIGNILPIVTTVSLGALGYYLTSSRSEDIQNIFTRPRQDMRDIVENIVTKEANQAQEEDQTDENSQLPDILPQTREAETFAKLADQAHFQAFKILDTSVIIDGRILDVIKTGFVEGIIVVPNFVLKELQYIADSADSNKRVRGRRGLDILNQIQDLPDVQIEFFRGDFEDEPEVDLKLLRLAEKIDGVVVTNDYNLNKVSQIHKIKVLNVNELAGSLKTVVLPGELMSVHLIKAGSERRQGVGYLDDGTMIVVEDGRDHLDEYVQVEVTSAIQTNAGRMIFAKLA